MPVENDKIKITGEECHHIKDVMRHKVGDELFVTNGNGSIYKIVIDKISKSEVITSIQEAQSYVNNFEKITFCIPRLKSAERFEFALEKCVELGITNFIIFESERTVAKGAKLERWNKILLSAMKQSLRAWMPKISYVKKYSSLFEQDGTKIIFEQTAEQSFADFLTTNRQLPTTNLFLIFGPEGGLTNAECRVQNAECRMLHLTDNRLRSETAIISAASLISLNMK